MHPPNRRESHFPSHGFRTVFWSYFLILNLFLMKSSWIHRLTTVFTPCKPSNLSRFWKFLRVSKFLNQTRSKSYGSMLIQIRCGSWAWRGEFLWLLPDFDSEIWVEIFGTLESWFCFADFLAWAWNLNGNPLLLLLNWFGSLWNSSPFLLNLPLWSCLSLPLLMVNSHWNCRENDSMMKIQCWISENPCKPHWILLNFDSGKSRVCVFLSFSVNLLDLICNWMERESEICLWLGAWTVYIFWLVQYLPFIGCHVCFWTNGNLPSGLSCPWQPGLFWPKDQNAILRI